MGRLGKTCGAATGAFMVIGLKHGKGTPEDEPARQLTYGLVQDFVRQFEAVNKTVVCRELLGYDLSTPEGYKAAREAGVFQTKCHQYVRDAVKILEGMGF